MTQKRFKKLLMSKGYGRNDVSIIAKNVSRSGLSYLEVYRYVGAGGKIDIDVSHAMTVLKEAFECICKVATACAKGIGAFCEEFNQALKGGEEKGVILIEK